MSAFRTVLARWVAVATIALATALATAQQALPEHLRFLATHNLFERIRSDPGFNLARPATFGYFFESADTQALARLREALVADGYTFVTEHVTRGGVAVLQVAKVETHNADSMVERNRSLFSMAASLSVSYTGWDITRNTQ